MAAFCPTPPLPRISRRRLRASAPFATARPPSASSSSAAVALSSLSARASALKCPFFRRRAGDALDAAARTLAFIASVRHKRLALGDVALASAERRGAVGTRCLAGLDAAARARVIEDDFVVRQYYVSGRLSAGLYREDCEFVSPDPDSNFHGVRKYCEATKGLFHRPQSRVELLRISVEEEGDVVAWWRLEGALRLPWLPRIKAYTGRTRYVFDEEGLVVKHEERWSLTFLDAFGSTLFPELGRRLGAPEAPASEVLMERWKEEGEEFDVYARRR